MVLLGDKAQLEEIVLILTQDSCTVCGESTIVLKIIYDAPDETPQ
jgi:hypothetical protein